MLISYVFPKFSPFLNRNLKINYIYIYIYRERERERERERWAKGEILDLSVGTSILGFLPKYE
jgi:hypothetical protein